MEMSRREFLQSTAGAMGIWGLQRRSSPVPVRRTQWLVLHDPDQCSLPESVLGYRGALPAEREGVSGCRLAILPALLTIEGGETMRWLAACLRQGATVMIESGVGFAGRGDLRQHRRAMRDCFQLDVQAPVDLWAHRSGPSTPYVDYTWPRRAKIRDFSRIVPPSERHGEIIARAGDVPVALKRRIGGGTLIYLGSPIGPALWAGDVEAKRWLSAVAFAA